MIVIECHCVGTFTCFLSRSHLAKSPPYLPVHYDAKVYGKILMSKDTVTALFLSGRNSSQQLAARRIFFNSDWTMSPLQCESFFFPPGTEAL